MAEKKPKIDLKSRLGKTSRPSNVPGITPGSSGIAPPPGILTPGGIPAPAFAAKQGPKVDASDPFASMSSDEMPAQKAGDIRVEISHDVVEAQAKSRSKVAIFAVLAGLVGIGIGFLLGQMNESSTVAQGAVKSAQEIADDVQKSDKEVREIGQKLDVGSKSLFGDHKFPDTLSKELLSLVVPFDATHIAGKTNRFRPTVLRALFDYTDKVQDLNNRREKLAHMLDNGKGDLVALLEQSENPRISYVVFIGKADKGAVATFAKLKTPFEFDKDWPDKLPIQKGSEIVDADRYKSGDVFIKPANPNLPNDKAKVSAIPVEADSVAKAFPNDLGQRFQSEIVAMTTLIKGNSGMVRPDEEEPGLIKRAEDILKELRQIGGKRQ